MSRQVIGSTPVAHPQEYQTVPMALISQAEQQDRCLKPTELQQLQDFFTSANKRLEVVETITNHADEIISAGANRIFFGGSPMDYLEKPQDPIGMPGSGYYIGEDFLSSAQRHGAVLVQEKLKLIPTPKFFNPFRRLIEQTKTIFSDREPLPGGFRFINISRYGSARMKRSMRDLAWFLRYITFAIVAGDTSILSVNARGLRGVIPEDVTDATVVALKEMQRQTLSYFPEDKQAQEMVKYNFEVLIAEYLVEKPPELLRMGLSNHEQGLVLPQSYAIASSPRPKFVMKSVLPETEKQVVIKAAYRQVFEHDVTGTYGLAVDKLESQVKSGQISMKEFIRSLGKSRLYRRLFWEPHTISRFIELAVRHFLGRGINTLGEFQEYFAIVTQGGLGKLVDTLVDSQEYSDYFGEETVPYLRGVGQEAQATRNWSPQIDLLKWNASVHKVPQFVTLFAQSTRPLPNQHPYGVGNDPLEIQFGAIFVSPDGKFHPSITAPFSYDHQRILISATGLGKVPGHIDRVMKLDQRDKLHLITVNGETSNGKEGKQHSSYFPSLDRNYPTVVINAAYRQVFGRELLDGQRVSSAESMLLSGEITVREFIRQLAKSRLFRKMFWESLYVTKSIEYIHRRLLGRPTYGRMEMNYYYDICANQGFYGLIDAIIDSTEYLEVFAEDTVPYERYITPQGYSMRYPKTAYAEQSPTKAVLSSQLALDRFIPHKNGNLNGKKEKEFTSSDEDNKSESELKLEQLATKVDEVKSGEKETEFLGNIVS